MTWPFVMGFLIGYIGEQIWEDIDNARIADEWRRYLDTGIAHTNAPERAEINAGREV